LEVLDTEGEGAGLVSGDAEHLSVQSLEDGLEDIVPDIVTSELIDESEGIGLQTQSSSEQC
jgi:hypothetical protein